MVLGDWPLRGPGRGLLSLHCAPSWRRRVGDGRGWRCVLRQARACSLARRTSPILTYYKIYQNRTLIRRCVVVNGTIDRVGRVGRVAISAIFTCGRSLMIVASYTCVQFSGEHLYINEPTFIPRNDLTSFSCPFLSVSSGSAHICKQLTGNTCAGQLDMP